MRIAIITSSGGSIFRQVISILRSLNSKIDFIMISDRECKAEQIAADFSLPLIRIEERDNNNFSARCREYIAGVGGVDVIMPFFSRLLTRELIDAYPCVNIHPALLPAFRGFKAVNQAYEAGVKFFGSTLHIVDEEVDHGPILAQVQMPRKNSMSLKEMIEAVFVQDVYLTLLLIDLLETKKLELYPGAKFHIQEDLPCTDRANPCLNNERYLLAVQELQKTCVTNVVL